MAVFDRFFKRSTDTAPAPEQESKPKTTITVRPGYEEVSNPTLAMKISTVYRCLDILSKSVASVPLLAKIRVDTEHGSFFKIDEGNPINFLLNVQPNDRLTAFELKASLILQQMTYGNAYVYIEGNPSAPNAFILCAPGSVTYDVYTNTYIATDTINNVRGRILPEKIIHIKNISMDGGYTGVSTLRYAARVLAISTNADEDQNNTFRSGGTLKGFVSGKSQTMGFGVVQDSQLDDVSESIENQINRGKDIFSLPGEMSFSQISLSAKDIELLESKKFNVFEICRFFGVHPDKVFAEQKSNYKASEMSQVDFLTDTLQPLLLNIQGAFASKLLSLSTYPFMRLEFEPESLFQTDLTTKAAYIEKTIATGVRTVNDWRRKDGQIPVKGGDQVLVSANIKPLGAEENQETSK